MLETYQVPLHLKNLAKHIGHNEIDRVRQLRFWKTLCIISWIITAIAIYLWLFIPHLEAKEITPLVVAQSQIGLGEIGNNNKGVYVRKYLNGQEGLPWCAGFVSYCLKKAGYNLPYILRAKDFVKYGKCIKEYEILPNDLVIFSRKGGGHIGIVIELGDFFFASIEGNVGKYPAKVRIVRHRYTDKNIYRFVRLSKQ